MHRPLQAVCLGPGHEQVARCSPPRRPIGKARSRTQTSILDGCDVSTRDRNAASRDGSAARAIELFMTGPLGSALQSGSPSASSQHCFVSDKVPQNQTTTKSNFLGLLFDCFFVGLSPTIKKHIPPAAPAITMAPANVFVIQKILQISPKPRRRTRHCDYFGTAFSIALPSLSTTLKSTNSQLCFWRIVGTCFAICSRSASKERDVASPVRFLASIYTL